MDIIQKSLDEKLLEHPWQIRTYITSLSKDYPNLSSDFAFLAILPFNYYKVNKNLFDRSLKCITEICQCADDDLAVCNDPTVAILSKYFNKVANSGRELFMCYDCGTVARAILLQLIKEYRGEAKFNKKEEEWLKLKYKNDDSQEDGIKRFDEMYKEIKKEKHCAGIMSISVGEDFGHVFVIEKDTDQYRLYQSCKNCYILLDFLEQVRYEEGKFDFDFDLWYKEMRYIMLKRPWGKKEIDIFKKWFYFTPSNILKKKSDKSNFCYSLSTL